MLLCLVRKQMFWCYPAGIEQVRSSFQQNFWKFNNIKFIDSCTFSNTWFTSPLDRKLYTIGRTTHTQRCHTSASNIKILLTSLFNETDKERSKIKIISSLRHVNNSIWAALKAKMFRQPETWWIRACNVRKLETLFREIR